MPLYFIYPLYTAILAIIAKILIPKDELKRLFTYALFFGGAADVIVIRSYRFLNMGGYINYGPFGFMGLPFFPIIAWICFFMIYYCFLPEMKIVRFAYIVIAAAYSVFFSNILINLGIFRWNYGRVVVPFCVFLIWISLATWGFLKLKLK